MTDEKFKAVWVDMEPIFRDIGKDVPPGKGIIEDFNDKRKAVLKKHGITGDEFHDALEERGI